MRIELKACANISFGFFDMETPKYTTMAGTAIFIWLLAFPILVVSPDYIHMKDMPFTFVGPARYIVVNNNSLIQEFVPYYLPSMVPSSSKVPRPRAG